MPPPPQRFVRLTRKGESTQVPTSDLALYVREGWSIAEESVELMRTVQSNEGSGYRTEAVRMTADEAQRAILDNDPSQSRMFYGSLTPEDAQVLRERNRAERMSAEAAQVGPLEAAGRAFTDTLTFGALDAIRTDEEEVQNREAQDNHGIAAGLGTVGAYMVPLLGWGNAAGRTALGGGRALLGYGGVSEAAGILARRGGAALGLGERGAGVLGGIAEGVAPTALEGLTRDHTGDLADRLLLDGLLGGAIGGAFTGGSLLRRVADDTATPSIAVRQADMLPGGSVADEVIAAADHDAAVAASREMAPQAPPAGALGQQVPTRSVDEALPSSATSQPSESLDDLDFAMFDAPSSRPARMAEVEGPSTSVVRDPTIAEARFRPWREAGATAARRDSARAIIGAIDERLPALAGEASAHIDMLQSIRSDTRLLEASGIQRAPLGRGSVSPKQRVMDYYESLEGARSKLQRHFDSFPAGPGYDELVEVQANITAAMRELVENDIAPLRTAARQEQIAEAMPDRPAAVSRPAVGQTQPASSPMFQQPTPRDAAAPGVVTAISDTNMFPETSRSWLSRAMGNVQRIFGGVDPSTVRLFHQVDANGVRRAMSFRDADAFRAARRGAESLDESIDAIVNHFDDVVRQNNELLREVGAGSFAKNYERQQYNISRGSAFDGLTNAADEGLANATAISQSTIELNRKVSELFDLANGPNSGKARALLGSMRDRLKAIELDSITDAQLDKRWRDLLESQDRIAAYKASPDALDPLGTDAVMEMDRYLAGHVRQMAGEEAVKVIDARMIALEGAYRTTELSRKVADQADGLTSVAKVRSKLKQWAASGNQREMADFLNAIGGDMPGYDVFFSGKGISSVAAQQSTLRAVADIEALTSYRNATMATNHASGFSAALGIGGAMMYGPAGAIAGAAAAGISKPMQTGMLMSLLPDMLRKQTHTVATASSHTATAMRSATVPAAAKAALRGAVRAGTTAYAYVNGTREQKVREAMRLADRVSAQMMDQFTMMESIQDEADIAAATMGPKVAGAITGKVMESAAWLAQRVPASLRGGNNSAYGVGVSSSSGGRGRGRRGRGGRGGAGAGPMVPISLTEVDAFLEGAAVIQDPILGIQMAAAGRLTSVGADALRTVHGAMYSAFLADVLAAVGDPRALPPRSRQRLAMLAGSTVDTLMTPENLEVLQSRWAQGTGAQSAIRSQETRTRQVKGVHASQERLVTDKLRQ